MNTAVKMGQTFDKYNEILVHYLQALMLKWGQTFDAGAEPNIEESD